MNPSATTTKLLTVSITPMMITTAIILTAFLSSSTMSNQKATAQTTNNSKSGEITASTIPLQQTYQSPQFGISFQYPSSWKTFPNTDLPSSLSPGIPTRILGIRSGEDFMQISIQNQSKYLDIKEMKVKNFTAHDYANVVTQLLPKYQFQLVRENPVTISGYPGWRIEYVTYQYKVEIYAVKDDIVYKIEFETPTLKAPESLPVAQKIIDSIKISSSKISLPKTDTTIPRIHAPPLPFKITPPPKPIMPPSEPSPPENIPGLP
jgi:hypothetical protein